MEVSIFRRTMSMKKMIIVALSIISMLIAFTSCDEPTVLPTGTAINDFADLKAFAEGTGEYAEVTEAYIAKDITITTDGVVFSRGNVTLNGYADILVENPDSLAVISIQADDVTFNDVDIEITGGVKPVGEEQNNTYAIVVSANTVAAPQSGAKNFVFDGGSITGEFVAGEGIDYISNDAPAEFNTVIGIAYQTNTSGAVRNARIAGCVAPINVSTGDITIEKVAINGHIYFDTAFGESKPTVKGVSSISDDWAGHVDFTSEITDGEALAKEMLKENSVKFYAEYKEVTAE